MLGRALSRMQWSSIGLLSLGVGIVQIATQATEGESRARKSGAVLPEPLLPSINSTIDPLLDVRSILSSPAKAVLPEMNQLLGLTAVCLACLSSGFASVFFEKQLKKPSPSLFIKEPKTPPTPIPFRKTGLWIRNIQLSLFSLVVGLVIYTCTSSDSLADFLVGFTPIVYFLVCLQVLGGLLAALVIQHADNIAKSFSASCSIILSFAASIVLFDYKTTPGIVVGGAAVIGATWLYSEFRSDLALAWVTKKARIFYWIDFGAAKSQSPASQVDQSPVLISNSPKAEYLPLRPPSRRSSQPDLSSTYVD